VPLNKSAVDFCDGDHSTPTMERHYARNGREDPWTFASLRRSNGSITPKIATRHTILREQRISESQNGSLRVPRSSSPGRRGPLRAKRGLLRDMSTRFQRLTRVIPWTVASKLIVKASNTFRIVRLTKVHSDIYRPLWQLPILLVVQV
jgi:hypothetical protein